MKTLIIIKREYLTRVRKKSFIIMTLLVPILFIGLAALIAGISLNSSGEKTIAILDESQTFENQIKQPRKIQFLFEHEALDSLKAGIKSGKYDAVLHKIQPV
jgi:ABC-2 type transport system permease protein